MSALTYNMKHFDQTTMFDSFMNSQDPLMENTNTIANNNISTSINHAEWLQDDIDIFKLYTKAHNNLSHVERILNLTWRLHTVRSRKLSNSNPPPSYTVENSFIFQQDISLSGQPSPFHDYTNSEYVPSQSGDPMDSNENNNNNNTNMFIDNDNLISKDNEFDMFLDEKFQSNHSMVTPMPMDIPQSVPTQNMLPHEHNNSFSNDHMSSSFVFNYMTPSSFTPSTSVNGFTPTTTSFIPTPVIPLTSTTTTNIFNDSTLLKNDNVSFSLPITNDMFKQKRSVGTTKKRSPSIAKSRTNSTSNNNNNNHNNNNNNNSNNNSTPMKCSNCGTHNTPLWRKDPKGNSLCNACGLFLKLHGVMRPLSLKTDTIKKRQRNHNNNSNNNNNNNTNNNTNINNSTISSRATTPNIAKKNYIKKVGSKEKINLDWLNLNL